MTTNTDDLRISEHLKLIAPEDLMQEVAGSDKAFETVSESRRAIQRTMRREDDRLVVVVGPCSIHDPAAAMEYAQRLVKVREELKDDLEIVMRVYFEKPRTTVGWKGLINDPDINDSFDINKGLRTARQLLCDINGLGLPCGVEYLDLISPQFIADLVAWGAIGARTTESQSHRELASGLSCPVGFKNGTAGSMQLAVDAIGSASCPHRFLSVTKSGHSAIFATTGNEASHIILRGGSKAVNHDAASVDEACALLAKSGKPERVMIDCSHANSRKKHERQKYVNRDICHQVADGDGRIFGVMIESNLVAGNQSYSADREPTYGQSITDACVDWESTVPMLQDLAAAVRARRAGNETS